MRTYLKLSLFLTGICCLVLEIAGQRLVSPFFGSSVFVWSSMITVTLVALSIGYALGGRVVDKNPDIEVYLRFLLASGIAVAFIPILRTKALVAAAPLGIKLGSLVGAGLLLGPSLLILGMLGPVAIRLITKEIKELGRSTGDAYAISTLGSVIGAVITGFWLIPNFSLSQILWSVAFVLITLSSVGFALKNRSFSKPLLLFKILLLVLIAYGSQKPTGLLFSKESVYGRVEVKDIESTRYLFVNNTIQSAMDLASGRAAVDYPYSHQFSLRLQPKAKSALVLGLGSGMITKDLESKSIKTTSIEIDPIIAKVAKDFFALPDHTRVQINDARVAMNKDQKTYDLIVLDAFGSESVPTHLFSREAFELVRARLNEDGVFSINLICFVKSPGDLAWKAIFSTLKAEFPFVRAFAVGNPSEDMPTNITFFASKSPLLEKQGVDESIKTQGILNDMKTKELYLAAPTLILSDEYSPLDSLLSSTMIAWRLAVQGSLSGDALDH